MIEFNELPIINSCDFRGLICARDCLCMNFRRLKARKLEFEINDSQTMKNIVAKFPQDQHLDGRKLKLKVKIQTDLLAYL